MALDRIEQKILQTIDKHSEELKAFGRDIYTHAELGYKEFRTSEKFLEQMEKLHLPVTKGLAITGAKAYLNPEKREQASIALIGELDALRITGHRYYNPETGGAHCCGHHAQLTGVVGAAIALTDPEVAAAMDGQVVFFATPAEEYGEVAFKNTLIAQKKIAYGGGKCELIREGAFDDIDLCIVHHLGANGIELGSGSGNGFVSKVIRYQGRAAHAAGAPEKGINALSAASLGLQALGLNRETFRDQDCVRVHPILTKGGELVNVVPDEAVLETLVRGKTIESILDADKKVDRAFRAGALALGAGYTIETMPGYLPSLPMEASPELIAAAQIAAPEKQIQMVPADQHNGGSTDVGDVQHLMPVFTFRTGGVGGGFHQSDFEILDEEEAYITTAKIFAVAAYRFLRDGAAGAKRAVNAYKPVFDKESYTSFMNQFNRIERKEIEEWNT